MCLCRVVRWLRCHLFFQSSDKINFSWRECRVGWRGGRSIWRYGMPLSLKGWGWGGGTQHGHAHGARRQMPKRESQEKKKHNKKTKETHTRKRQELQLAPGGGISLTGTRLSLMRKGKTRVWKRKGSTCECVFECLCAVDFFFRCLSSLAVSVCRQGAPALAPHQPPSCVHSALPLAAGKLVQAICHSAPHTPLSCVLLFMPLRKVNVCAGVWACTCADASVSCLMLPECLRKLGVHLFGSFFMDIRQITKIKGRLCLL